MIPKCFICGRALSVAPDRGWRNWVCGDCAEQHDLKRPCSEWPTWAREFCNAHEGTERRRERQREAAGIEFVPLEEWTELRDSAE